MSYYIPVFWKFLNKDYYYQEDESSVLFLFTYLFIVYE